MDSTNHCHCQHPLPDLKCILDQCKSVGLRQTKALQILIDSMLSQNRPLTLAALCSLPQLESQCDNATVFRLLQRLCSHHIVRKMGLHERSSYYTLLLPGHHHDYIVCSHCGSIEPINAPCPVQHLEQEIRHQTGFKNLYHELNFFGICPTCAASSDALSPPDSPTGPPLHTCCPHPPLPPTH